MSDSSKKFRKLHNGEQLLILPNAWDVGSALLFEQLGATANCHYQLFNTY